jgi:predicted O-methyltransferase YrrM
MAISSITKIGIILAVGVLAGLSSALLSVLLLAIAGLLIAWEQNPKATEAFFESLPYGNYSSKAFSRLSAILSA